MSRAEQPRCGASGGSLRRPEPYGRYPSRRRSGLEQHSNPTSGSYLQIWLGWKDSNLRMAGSKPAIVTSIINKLLILFTRLVPSTPFDSPSLPLNLPLAIRETAVVLGPVRGTRSYLLLSANLRPPYGTLSPYTDSAAGASARRPGRSEGVAGSRTSSHQSRKGC